MSNETVFVKYAIEKLEQYESRVKACVRKLTPAQVWARSASNENAIGNLLLHLNGNVRQWIICGIGGERDTRQRQTEFDAQEGFSPEELLARLHGTLVEAIVVISGLGAERLAEPVKIQGYDVTVLQAVFHVVEHFSGHTGQIIFATKYLTGEDLGFYRHLRVAAAHDEKTP